MQFLVVATPHAMYQLTRMTACRWKHTQTRISSVPCMKMTKPQMQAVLQQQTRRRPSWWHVLLTSMPALAVDRDTTACGIFPTLELETDIGCCTDWSRDCSAGIWIPYSRLCNHTKHIATVCSQVHKSVPLCCYCKMQRSGQITSFDRVQVRPSN